MPINTVPATATASTNEKLDLIAEYLRRMDQRDRLRMWGGFFRTLIAIVPMIVFLWSLWYFANHADELMKKIANQAASSAAEYTKQNSQGMVEQLMKQYKTK